MKKVYLYILGLILALSSCSIDNDYIFGDISTYRLNEFIAECDETLLSSEHGWLFTYYPDTANYGAYTFWMEFNEGGRVQMLSDFVNETVADTSSYGYVASLGPVLSFNTYSMLHLLNDPDPKVMSGRAGAGFGGDFEFLIRDVQPDRIELLGKKGRMPAELVKATAEDRERIHRRRDAIQAFTIDPSAPFYNYLEIANDTAFFFYSPSLRMAFMTYRDGDKTIDERMPVYSTERGIAFKEPLTFAGATFSELGYSTLENQYTILTEGINHRFFRAESIKDSCLVRFPGSVDMVHNYGAGFAMVDKGVALTTGKLNLFPNTIQGFGTTSDAKILEFRFGWNIDGAVGAGIFVEETVKGGNCNYFGKYDYVLADSVIGDKLRFTDLTDSYSSGNHQQSTDIGFGLGYKGSWLPDYAIMAGPLALYMLPDKHIVIPAGGQFFMIQNGNNTTWALYTPIEKTW